MIILVDLDKLTLFGTVSSSSPIMKMRRLISSNTSSVESYLAYSKEKISDHKIISKLSTLINDWDQFPLSEHKSSLNKIDNQLCQIFTKVEKLCRKLRMGQVDYSPTLSEAGLYWVF